MKQGKLSFQNVYAFFSLYRIQRKNNGRVVGTVGLLVNSLILN